MVLSRADTDSCDVNVGVNGSNGLVNFCASELLDKLDRKQGLPYLWLFPACPVSHGSLSVFRLALSSSLLRA